MVGWVRAVGFSVLLGACTGSPGEDDGSSDTGPGDEGTFPACQTDWPTREVVPIASIPFEWSPRLGYVLSLATDESHVYATSLEMGGHDEPWPRSLIRAPLSGGAPETLLADHRGDSQGRVMLTSNWVYLAQGGHDLFHEKVSRRWEARTWDSLVDAALMTSDADAIYARLSPDTYVRLGEGDALRDAVVLGSAELRGWWQSSGEFLYIMGGAREERVDVLQLPVSGGAPRPVASIDWRLDGEFVVAGGAVYTATRPPSSLLATLEKIPLDGSPHSVVAFVENIADLTASDDFVYWAELREEETSLWRLDLERGCIEERPGHSRDVRHLSATPDGDLVIAEGFELRRIPR
jgi:hypothetical protein